MKSKIKMPKMDQLLNDKNVLYIVFVVAILNLLGYLITNNLEAVVSEIEILAWKRSLLAVAFRSCALAQNDTLTLCI